MGTLSLIVTGVALLLASGQVNTADLTPDQKQIFEKVTQEEFCGCQSPLTLAGCLANKPKCRYAVDVSEIILNGVRKGGQAEALMDYLARGVTGPMCGTPVAFKVEGAPQKGKSTAPVTVVEFADFRCSHCREAVPTVHKAVQSNPKVRLVYMPFALQENALSVAAAEAAMAAQAQGKFWEMHAALFAQEDNNFDAATLSAIAKKVGLNMKTFDKDMSQHRFRELIMAFHKQGVDAGVVGTPTFFVNGNRFDAMPEVCTLEDRFTLELDRRDPQCQ